MIMDHKLKLMVVDDSPLFRTWLIRSLSEDERFQVCLLYTSPSPRD